MLRIYTSLSQLRWSELMAVYGEGVEENGAIFYKDLPKGQQILLAEQDFYTYLQQDFFRFPDEVYYIWEEDEHYVSALRIHPFEDGLLMEALETHPDHRRMGYGRRLIQAVLKLVRPQKVYSHISIRNTPSIAVHESCGFRKILNFARYSSGAVDTYHHTYLYET